LLDEACNITGRELAVRLYEKDINTDTFRYTNTIVCNYPLFRQFYNVPKYTGNNVHDFPNATNLVNKMLILPCHERISNDAIQYASKIILEITGR